MLRIRFFFALLFLPFSALGSVRVAITVDDLPVHSSLPPGVTRQEVARKMVAILKEAKIPAVYGFMNAKKNDVDPSLDEVLKIWTDGGNLLGNHTYSHRNLNKITAAEFIQEIERNEAALKKFSSNSDWRYFRYPFLIEGDTLAKRNQVRDYLSKNNYRVAEVTIDFEDWSWNDPYARCVSRQDSKAVEWLKKTYLDNALSSLERAQEISDHLFKRPIAHVLLLHVGAFDAEMLKSLIEAYRKRGVEFVSLESAQRDPVYALNPQVTFDHGAELIYQVMKERGLSTKDLNLWHTIDYPEAELEKLCR